MQHPTNNQPSNSIILQMLNNLVELSVPATLAFVVFGSLEQ